MIICFTNIQHLEVLLYTENGGGTTSCKWGIPKIGWCLLKGVGPVSNNEYFYA